MQGYMMQEETDNSCKDTRMQRIWDAGVNHMPHSLEFPNLFQTDFPTVCGNILCGHRAKAGAKVPRPSAGKNVRNIFFPKCLKSMSKESGHLN